MMASSKLWTADPLQPGAPEQTKAQGSLAAGEAATPVNNVQVADAAQPDPTQIARAQAAAAMPAATLQAPALPLAEEEPATPAATRSVLGGMVDSVSDYAAFAIIQQGQIKALTLAGSMRRAAQKSVIGESMNAVGDLIKQIAGERSAAGYKLLGASLGAFVSAGSGMAGATMRRANTADGQASAGAALDGSAQQLGNLMSSLVDMADKRAGGTYTADQARLNQREDEVRKSIAQQVLDSARGVYDQADKALANAMQSFMDYFKRKEGLMGNIANR